jgi:hypothetical protein
MRYWGMAIVLSCVVVTASAGELHVRLSDVPQQIRLPLREGANVVLTAQVEGEARSVWLASSAEARARCLLERVGESAYQVNLADPVVSAMLEAAGGGQVRVFAEAPNGTVSASIPVVYSVGSTEWQWLRPPRVFVHTADGVREVTEWADAWDPGMAAFMAEMRGQGIAFTAPGLSDFPFGPGGRAIEAWIEPSDVERLEARFDPDADDVSARAEAGPHQWNLAAADPANATYELAVSAAVEEAWKEAGELSLACTQDDGEELRVSLKVPPARLDLPEGRAELTVVQRFTVPVPGSDGYLLLHIGDITGGQTLLTLKSADGRRLVEGKSVRRDESVRFRLGEHQYELTLKKLVNFLVGDDYAVFVVAPQQAEGASEEHRPPAAEAPAGKAPPAAP